MKGIFFVFVYALHAHTIILLTLLIVFLLLPFGYYTVLSCRYVDAWTGSV
jgi:hypothetical protein